jgi:hypothetical protein
METVNLTHKSNLFSDYCNPRVIAEVNDSHVKAVKLKGEFIWHTTKTKTNYSWS